MTHFSKINDFIERSSNIIANNHQTFVIGILVYTRLYHEDLLECKSISVILLSDIFIEHCSFVNTFFIFLLFISIEGNNFHKLFTSLSLDFNQIVLGTQNVWVINGVNYLDFVSLLEHEAVWVFIDFDGVIQDVGVSVCEVCLNNKFSFSLSLLIIDVTEKA